MDADKNRPRMDANGHEALWSAASLPPSPSLRRDRCEAEGAKRGKS